jgi:hypothetical protein
MILPSQLAPPTTDTAGYFRYRTEALADWLATALGPDWRRRRLSTDSLAEVVAHLAPQAPLSRYALLPVGDWTVLLNDGPNGTDLGVLPMHAARDLGCSAVRAVAILRKPDRFPATIMEVYEPTAPAPLRCRRSIYAADDGGRWTFGEFGERFAFEEEDAYARRRVRDRFTPDMLERYLRALSVPVNDEPDTRAGVVVEKPRRWSRVFARARSEAPP